jgi:putative transcriptional regulator
MHLQTELRKHTMSLSKTLARRLIDSRNRRDSDFTIDPDAFSVKVKTVRKENGLTQEQFAELYRIPIGTVRNWEQAERTRRPDSAAELLILLIKEKPQLIADLIKNANRHLSALDLIGS